ncbi:MAG: hypothetical protein ACI4E1_13205 [Lachnospira sp.]
MRKYRLLALTLVLVMMVSTVMGCGGNKDTADADATNEETTVEATTETVEETETEYLYSATYRYALDNERYPVSDETKAMLIEKLTGLTLKKNEEFDFSTLSFKEDEQKACDRLKVLLTDVMFAEKSENDRIVCNLDYVKIVRIDQTYKGLFLNFEQGNGYNFTNKEEYVNEINFEIDYSLYTISDETKAMLIEKLTNLELEKSYRISSI